MRWLDDIQIIRTAFLGTIMWLGGSGIVGSLFGFVQDLGWAATSMMVVVFVTCAVVIRELCLRGSPGRLLDITHSGADKVGTPSGGMICYVTIKNRSSRAVETKLRIAKLEPIPVDPAREKIANRFVDTYLTPQDAEFVDRTYEEIATFRIERGSRKRIQVVHFRNNKKWYVLIAKMHLSGNKWHRDDAEITTGRYSLTLVAESIHGQIGEATFEFNCTDAGIAVFDQARTSNTH